MQIYKEKFVSLIFNTYKIKGFENSGIFGSSCGGEEI